MLRFEWDERKNQANQRRHGVAFDEAQTAFFYERAIAFHDPDHSDQEDRFLSARTEFSAPRSRCLPLLSKERCSDSPDLSSSCHAKGARCVRAQRQAMRKEYDFSKMKGRRNPYAKRLKKQITIRVGIDVLEYFKELAAETGIPYQNLIDMYLRDCVIAGKRPSLKWAS